MPDTPGTTNSAHPLTHDDPEILPPSPLGETLRPILSRLANMVRQHPFLSATILHVSFAGMIVGLAKRSYNWDVRPAYDQIPRGRDGVSPCYWPQSGSDTTYRRSHSSDVVIEWI